MVSPPPQKFANPQCNYCHSKLKVISHDILQLLTSVKISQMVRKLLHLFNKETLTTSQHYAPNYLAVSSLGSSRLYPTTWHCPAIGYYETIRRTHLCFVFTSTAAILRLNSQAFPPKPQTKNELLSKVIFPRSTYPSWELDRDLRDSWTSDTDIVKAKPVH